MSRAALEPTQHLVQRVLVFFFFFVVKLLVHDVDPSLSSSTEVKNEWSFTSTPCGMPSWHGQGQCTFSPALRMVEEIMVVEIIVVYDVCWIYLAQDRDHWWASCICVEMCEIS
jgi:hypothetical protein